MTCKEEAHPEQWLGGLGGLKRLAVCMVGGQRSVLDNSRHGAVDLSPCKGHAWSGIAGSLRLSLTSAQSHFLLHGDSNEQGQLKAYLSAAPALHTSHKLRCAMPGLIS